MKLSIIPPIFLVGCRFDLPPGLTPSTSDAPADALADVPADALPDAPITGCPADYAPLSGGSAGHRYRLLGTRATWALQSAACNQTSTSAYLAIPDNASELAALDSLVHDLFWVGINDMATEGMYVTIFGASATVLPWGQGEPDGTVYPEEDCVAAVGPTRIVDLPCNDGPYSAWAVCECEP